MACIVALILGYNLIIVLSVIQIRAYAGTGFYLSIGASLVVGICFASVTWKLKCASGLIIALAILVGTVAGTAGAFADYGPSFGILQNGNYITEAIANYAYMKMGVITIIEGAGYMMIVIIAIMLRSPLSLGIYAMFYSSVYLPVGTYLSIMIDDSAKEFKLIEYYHPFIIIATVILLAVELLKRYKLAGEMRHQPKRQ